MYQCNTGIALKNNSLKLLCRVVKIYPSSNYSNSTNFSHSSSSIGRLHAACTWCAIAFFSVFLFKNPNYATSSVVRALRLCVTNVIPSLFPYMVISALILSSGLAQYIGRVLSKPFSALFAMSGSCAAAFIIGMVAGFPVGAKTAAMTYRNGLCEQNDAQRLCSFCNNTGPAFVIGAVGAGFFGNTQTGIALYCIEVLSAVLVGIILSIGKERKNTAPNTAISFCPDFTGAVRGAVSSILGICGFVVFFSVLNECVTSVLESTIFSPFLPIIASLLEVTNGCALAAQIGGASGFILCAFAIGWSGMCVHAQSAAYILGEKLSMKKYLVGKASQGALCAALSAVYCLFLRNI